MKLKKLISLLLIFTLVLTLAACDNGNNASSEPADSGTTSETADSGDDTEPTEPGEAGDLSVLKGKKIGISIQSLENAYWAGVMTALQEELDAAGAEYTLLDCKDNSATQISQVENFISAEMDLIMVHPSDAAALEDICGQARDAGIKVMCWDDPMENTDANWVLDNTDLGKKIGNLAGEFINEHYSEDNKAQVALIGYPQTVVLLERANGIKAGLEETAAGKFEIVAEQEGLEAPQAQTSIETILQAYPDLKVVVGVGAGAMIGSNEALMTHTGGDVPEDMGVFTTDVTKQQLEGLLSDEAMKGIIGFEGSDEDTARACAEMYARILNNEFESGDKTVFRETSQITVDNAKDILDGMK